jgi:hypothetical protein
MILRPMGLPVGWRPPGAGEAMVMWPGDYDVMVEALRLRRKRGDG